MADFLVDPGEDYRAGEDARTPEQRSALEAKQRKQRAYFLPLYEKATRQLQRAEQAFLLASDASPGRESEVDAMRTLHAVQSIRSYYLGRLNDVKYAYLAEDLDWFDYEVEILANW